MLNPEEKSLIKKKLFSMKVAILWTRLSGYFNACLKALLNKNIQLFVSYQLPDKDAPFNDPEFDLNTVIYRYEVSPDTYELKNSLIKFKPDVIIISSWHIKAYRRISKYYRGKALRVLAMDNQWRGTVKQHIGSFLSPIYIQPLYDAVWLPGERQAVFAEKLGFTDKHIWRGLYTCDHEKFAEVFRIKQKMHAFPHSFIFVGRLLKIKGINNLLSAYKIYYDTVSNPWPLIICGKGPFEKECRETKGVVYKDFIQPSDLPSIFKDAGCFVLPSIFEKWGIVIHEAASSGTPIICSTACGASVHLVQDGFNGYLINPNNVTEFVCSLKKIHNLSEDKLRNYSVNSYNLSKQYTPAQWADYFLEKVRECTLL